MRLCAHSLRTSSRHGGQWPSLIKFSVLLVGCFLLIITVDAAGPQWDKPEAPGRAPSGYNRHRPRSLAREAARGRVKARDTSPLYNTGGSERRSDNNDAQGLSVSGSPRQVDKKGRVSVELFDRIFAPENSQPKNLRTENQPSGGQSQSQSDPSLSSAHGSDSSSTFPSVTKLSPPSPSSTSPSSLNPVFPFEQETCGVETNLVWRNTLSRGIFASPVIDSLSTNAKKTIIVPSFQEDLTLLSRDGHTLPGYPVTLKNRAAFQSSPLLFDFDGDGYRDIISVSADAQIFIVDGKPGRPPTLLSPPMDIPKLKIRKHWYAGLKNQGITTPTPPPSTMPDNANYKVTNRKQEQQFKKGSSRQLFALWDTLTIQSDVRGLRRMEEVEGEDAKLMMIHGRKLLSTQGLPSNRRKVERQHLKRPRLGREEGQRKGVNAARKNGKGKKGKKDGPESMRMGGDSEDPRLYRYGYADDDDNYGERMEYGGKTEGMDGDALFRRPRDRESVSEGEEMVGGKKKKKSQIQEAHENRLYAEDPDNGGVEGSEAKAVRGDDKGVGKDQGKAGSVYDQVGSGLTEEGMDSLSLLADMPTEEEGSGVKVGEVPKVEGGEDKSAQQGKDAVDDFELDEMREKEKEKLREIEATQAWRKKGREKAKGKRKEGKEERRRKGSKERRRLKRYKYPKDPNYVWVC